MDDESPSRRAEKAYREHREKIFRFLLRKTRDADEGEELTQQVFADVTAALARVDAEPRSLVAWLYAVAERRFVDEMRRRSRMRRIIELSARAEEVDPEEGYGPAVARSIQHAIERLPAEQRRVVVMKVLEGRPFTEIARTLGVSEAACKMRLSRALRAVRRYLEEEGLGGGEPER